MWLYLASVCITTTVYSAECSLVWALHSKSIAHGTVCSCTDQNVEDSAKHSGKKRSFAHVRGNWPTYIYVPGQSVIKY